MQSFRLHRSLHRLQQVAEESIAMKFDLQLIAVLHAQAASNVLFADASIIGQLHLLHQSTSHLQIEIELGV